MPTADGADRNELIQISGSTEPKIQVNTCVAPGFACGLNPWVPDAVPQACIKRSGNWRFINFATQWNPTAGCDRPYGFYVAVYSTPCRTSVCSAAAGGPDSPQQFGLFEAAKASEGYLFDRFISDVLTKNGDASKLWDSERGNPYETVKGTKLVFTPNRVAAGWTSLGVTANDDDLRRWGIREIANEKQETEMWKWPLAGGSIMNSETDGRGNRLACVMIDNPALQWGRSLLATKVGGKGGQISGHRGARFTGDSRATGSIRTISRRSIRSLPLFFSPACGSRQISGALSLSYTWAERGRRGVLWGVFSAVEKRPRAEPISIDSQPQGNK